MSQIEIFKYLLYFTYSYYSKPNFNEMSCIVPGCSSNYRGEEHFTKVFSFPKDDEVREKWFRAIPRPREDYKNNKNLKASTFIFLFIN